MEAAERKQKEQELTENVMLQKARIIGEAKQTVEVLKGPFNQARLLRAMEPLAEAVEALKRAEDALVEFRKVPTAKEVAGAAPHFFLWVAKCCALLGKPREYGTNMMPEVDLSWWACFDDGMTPEAAVAEYKAKVPEKERP